MSKSNRYGHGTLLNFIDEFGSEKPKCKHCSGEFEVAPIKDSNGGSFDLVCKNCGKHIH